MAQLSAMHLVLSLTVLLSCLSAIATSLTIEQQLEELKENYVKKQDILESKINRLEAEVEEMERMEEKQELLLSDLKQQSNSLRDSISGNDRQLGGWGSSFRQASGSSQVPRCCCDLLCNGETVSGLYSIMGNTSVEMVYCDFSKPPQDPNFQKWLGYVDVKSSPVYFYVQKNDSFETFGVPIPFEVEKVNIGGAMNLTSGIFTAPRPGTYFFAFTGNIGYKSIETSGPSTFWFAVIDLKLNGKIVGFKRIKDSIDDVYTDVTIQSTLSLKAGDQICVEILYVTVGVSLFDAKNIGHNHFTGMLMEENLAGRL